MATVCSASMSVIQTVAPIPGVSGSPTVQDQTEKKEGLGNLCNKQHKVLKSTRACIL